MRILSILIVLLLLTLSNLHGQSRPLGEWGLHLPYKNGKCLTEVDGEIMVGTLDSYLFSYNPAGEGIQKFDKLNGFAHQDVAAITYESSTELMVVAYEDSNIDLVKSGLVVNMPQIKDKNIVGAKNINHVMVIEGLVYVASGFGIIVIDPVKEEVKDTYYIGPESSSIQIYDLAFDGQRIYAATELGILSGDLNDPGLVNYANWYLYDATDGIPGDKSKAIHFNGDAIYAGSNEHLVKLNSDETWSVLSNGDTDFEITKIDDRSGEIIFMSRAVEPESREARLDFYDLGSGQTTEVPSFLMEQAKDMIVASDGKVYMANDWYGLVFEQGGSMFQVNKINGPNSNDSHKLSLKDNKLWVAPGTITSSWSFGANFNGYYTLDGNFWEVNRPDILQQNGIKNIVSVANHPTQDRTFFASFYEGVLERNGDEYIHHRDDSSLSPAIGIEDLMLAGDLLFDESANLWVSNFRSPKPINVYTPEGQWMSFATTVGGTTGLNQFTHMINDNFGNLWFVVFNEGILCYNPGEDVLEASDDQQRLFRKVNDDLGLPNNEVTCIVEDLEDEIWVGTKAGIGIFYQSSDPFNQDYQFSKPIVASGTFPYLMQTEYIHVIEVDPADRKWIGTNNGVFLLSSDGRETVHHFTTENSPLLDNSINDILVDEKTGLVYFATEKGLCSYQSDAVFGEYFHEGTLIYPNPVRPEYEGPIAIKGLYRNADVRITDLRGRLVYQTTALGGQAVWDGLTYDGERPQTGVYLIYSSSERGNENFVGKLLFVH